MDRNKMSLGNAPLKIGRFVTLVQEYNKDQVSKFNAFHGKVRQQKKKSKSTKKSSLPVGMEFGGTEPTEMWSRRGAKPAENVRYSYLDQTVTVCDTPLEEGTKTGKKKKKKHATGRL
jgi:hypothetical protein